MSEEITLSVDDRQDIHDVLHKVAYLLDARSYDRLGEVFSPDVHFDNPKRLTVDGLEALIDAFSNISDPAISHHITNVIITAQDSESVCTTSKALTIRSDRSLAAAEYTDVVARTPKGWRIASRQIKALPA